MRSILKRPMFRKGGLSTTTRMGYNDGTIPPVKMPNPLEELLARMTPEEREMFLMQMEMMNRGFEIDIPENPDAIPPVKMPDYSREDRAMGGRMHYEQGTDPVADAKELMEIENMRDPFTPFDMSEEKETVKEKYQPKSREDFMRTAMEGTGIMDQFINPKKDRRMANLALRFGANLSNPNLRGSFLQKVAQAGAGAVPGLIQETEAMDNSEAGINALKMKRFMDIYDREELRNYKQSQAEDGIDDQETAYMKNVEYAVKILYPGKNFAELAEEEQGRVIGLLNKDVQSDAEKRDKYLSGIYEVKTEVPKISNFDDDIGAYTDAVTEYENKVRNKIRSQKIHDDLLSSGKIDGIDITTVSIFDSAKKSVDENVLYEIAMDMKAPEGARYFYRDRDDNTNVLQTIYLDSGFNPII
jgi:hypothetical protein